MTRYIRIILVVLAVVVPLALFPQVLARVLPGGQPVREITLVARGMQFYVEGAGPLGPNPTIRLKAGERVRLNFRNDDPGMLHDVTIEPWNVRLKAVKDEGTGRLEFSVPERKGQFEYVCTPHSAMMRGSIEVD